MESVVTKLASRKLSTCAAIILMFTYTILLDRDFVCTCKPQGFECNLYLGLPVCIILLLILWTDESFQTLCRYLVSCSLDCFRLNTCGFWGSFLHHVLKAALVSLLWVAFVFLDGDWYVCCKNDHTERQTQLACKDAVKITEKEHEAIADLKNTSRVIGGFMLFGIVLVAFLMLFRLQTKRCDGKSSCCNRRFLYEKLILAEEDNVLKEILRKSAKDQLTREVELRISGGKWEECFDVAVDLINASDKPTISREQQRRQPGTAGPVDDNQHEEQEDRL